MKSGHLMVNGDSEYKTIKSVLEPLRDSSFVFPNKIYLLTIESLPRNGTVKEVNKQPLWVPMLLGPAKQKTKIKLCFGN